MLTTVLVYLSGGWYIEIECADEVVRVPVDKAEGMAWTILGLVEEIR